MAFLRGNRPNFAARLPERSGKPPPTREAVLLKRARLFILPANAARGRLDYRLQAPVPVDLLFNAKSQRGVGLFTPRVGRET